MKARSSGPSSGGSVLLAFTFTKGDVMQLFEEYRPKNWDEVVGQDRVLEKIKVLFNRGLSGRAYWLSGSSGTGKTTIAPHSRWIRPTGRR